MDRFLVKGKSTWQNLYLNVSGNPSEIDLNKIVDIVKSTFGKYQLKRYDENGKAIEVSFVIDSPKPEKLQDFKAKVSALSREVRVSFVESKSF